MSPPRVLIVDDDTALLQALPEALRLRIDAIVVDTCDTASEALERLATTDYDAIVSDIKMPGMDGLALLAKIRALRPDTPTLLITGHGEHDLAVQALRGGADDFIQKPIEREYFVAALSRAIQLRQLRRRVKELDELKTQFFANVSHELRTPLALVLGPIQRLLTAGGLTDEQRRDLAVIDRNARTLLTHVNDLLDIAKLDAGQMHVNYADIDLGRLLRVTAAHFETFAQERRISFALETPPVTIQGDPEKLARVFLNLLSNAFKFVPDGGRVRCAVHVEGDRVVITVQDNGPGVKAELREAIFARFRQGDEQTSGRFGGTGLGLAIAKDFVALHGGTITVSDAPGGGALFSVGLPLLAPPGTQAGRTRDSGNVADLARQTLDDLRGNRGGPGGANHATIANQATRGAGTNGAVTTTEEQPLVLVVEDNPDMNRFIVEALVGRYRVVKAFDGREGLDKALALRPDLILSDIIMPRLSGDALVREIRSHPELDPVPIVLLTAKVDDELRIKLLRDGAQDYLTKPFSAGELRTRVSNLIAMKQARETLQRELASRNNDLAALAREVGARGRQIAASLREKEVLLKELHHRVKNNLQVICSLLSLQSRMIEDRPTRELFASSQHRVKSMALIHEQLYQSKDLATIDLAEYVRRLAVNLFHSYGVSPDAVVLTMNLEEVSLGIDTALPCGLIINELVTNSLKHAFPPGKKGEIRIGLHSEPDGSHELSISDDGIGLPAEAARSTAPASGLQLVTTLAEQLGAAVRVQRDGGTRFSIRFSGEAEHEREAL